MWHCDDPQGNEAGKIKYDIVAYTRGAVLDLGCGPSKAFPHFIGVDSGKDIELFGVQMKPDVVCDVADPTAIEATFQEGSVDAIFSSHCLEHIEDYRAALAAWWSLIKVGGHLCLYLPHRDLYPNIGEFGANPDHKHDFVPDDIIEAMLHVAVQAGTGMDIVVKEVRDQGMEYSFLLVLRKDEAIDGVDKFCRSYITPRPEKTVCVCRYGGFGDMLQTSNILPQLKRDGYHVTLMTTPKGQDILQEDPHIDDWFIQDNDQVPNHELTAFWAAQARRFDKFINLSESVEGTLLALPGRTNHSWPDAVRRVELNRNYLEWTAQLAELPYHSEAKFYPTEREVEEAKRYIGGLRAERAPQGMVMGQVSPPVFSILWVLAGSSIHKFTPWQDTVIARILLDMPEATVIFNGDHACTILEAGWENEKRVKCESGNMDIRSSLALAQVVDCVVGPETGVLNAVAFEPNAKVVMLSHSSVENLTKHWTHTVSLVPDTPCYPCHRLHYGRDFCFEHAETGAAMCQVSITPDSIYDAIHAAYLQWKGKTCNSNN